MICNICGMTDIALEPNHKTLYDQLNCNLHPCNCTNQYICYFNNSIFAV